MRDEDQFSTSEEYQSKILSMMLRDNAFREAAAEALVHEDFSTKAHHWFFSRLSDRERPHTLVTLKEDLLNSANKKEIKETDFPKYIEVFKSLKISPTLEERDHLSDNLSRFIKTQAVKRVMLDVFPLVREARWDEITQLVQEAVQKGSGVNNLGQDYVKELDERLCRVLEVETERIPTAIPELDDILNGGIKNKQLGLIIGGTGRGKTVFMRWLAKVALLLGKKVVYYTLELPEDDISLGFDAMLSRTKFSEIKDDITSVSKKVKAKVNSFPNSLIVKEYPADEATVHTIKAHLALLRSNEIVPDLIIIDYLDLLKPHRHYNSSHEELDSITKALHGLSKSLDVSIWTATQLNRHGLTMENPDESGIAGALAKLFTVDIGIFMAQTNEEREDQVMRLIVSKNRNGPAGRMVALDTDYSYMTFYKSTVSLETEEQSDV